MFRLRSLLLVFIVIAGIFSIIQVLGNWQDSKQIVTREKWPTALRELLLELPEDEYEIEVRRGVLVLSYHWRMKTSAAALDAHLHRFQLEQVEPNGIEAVEHRDRFPSAWQWPNERQRTVYANPTGTNSIPDGGQAVIVIQDQEKRLLYGYWYFNF